MNRYKRLELATFNAALVVAIALFPALFAVSFVDRNSLIVPLWAGAAALIAALLIAHVMAIVLGNRSGKSAEGTQ